MPRHAHLRTTASGRPPRRRARPLQAVALLLLLVSLLAGCGQATSPASVPPPPVAPPGPAEMTAADVDAWLDGMLPAGLERAGIAGATVAVVHDGEVLTTRGYGSADVGGEGRPAVPVDPARTLFRVGSISKTVTATAVMQLVEQGRIDLDADVQGYLDFTLPAPEGTITMRHLLSHTAGFEERARPGFRFSGAVPDLRQVVVEDPPEQVFAPGTVPAYSNYGNTLAGYVVQRVSGMPFDSYAQRGVFDRVGMSSSTFAQPLPTGLAPRMSQGYRDDRSPAQPFELVAPAPAGAMSSTADDMARYMLAQLGALGAEPTLLSPATLEQMHSPALDDRTLGAFAQGPRMTLGFFDASRQGQRILGHEGDTNWFHSDLEIYPDTGDGIFISMNSTGRVGGDPVLLRDAVTQQFTERYFPQPQPPEPQSEMTPEDATGGAAAALAGTYESSRSPYSTFLSLIRLAGPTTITPRADGTVLVAPGPNALHPEVYAQVGPGQWREVGGWETFSTRGSGAQVQAIAHDNAFTLLRTQPVLQPAMVLPVLLAAVGVLLVAALAWPVRTLVRRHYRRPGTAPTAMVLARRVAVGASLAGLLGWGLVLAAVTASTDVPDPALRLVQVLQLVGALGVLPAAACLVRAARERGAPGAGWRRIVGSAALLLALGAVATFAVVYRLLSPSVSY